MSPRRELVVVGAAAAVGWVWGAHVLHPISPCSGTTVCRVGAETSPRRPPPRWACPQPLGPGPVTYSSQFSVKVMGEGYHTVCRHFKSVHCHCLFFKRGHVNTRKQVENENKSESSDLKYIVSIEKAILSLFFCGLQDNSPQTGFCGALG